jgi:hypothetical protein
MNKNGQNENVQNSKIDSEITEAANNSSTQKNQKIFFEDLTLQNGSIHTRFKSGFFYSASIIAFVSGFIMLFNDLPLGGFLILTASPFFLLYPLVRFFFGGKDGLLPAVVTFVAQEVIKSKIQSSLDKNKKKR